MASVENSLLVLEVISFLACKLFQSGPGNSFFRAVKIISFLFWKFGPYLNL